MEILNSLWESICSIFTSSGLATLSWENYVMMCISFILLYLAIKKQYEPLLLLPIAFGMLLVNVFPGIMANQQMKCSPKHRSWREILTLLHIQPQFLMEQPIIMSVKTVACSIISIKAFTLVFSLRLSSSALVQ